MKSHILKRIALVSGTLLALALFPPVAEAQNAPCSGAIYTAELTGELSANGNKLVIDIPSINEWRTPDGGFTGQPVEDNGTSVVIVVPAGRTAQVQLQIRASSGDGTLSSVVKKIRFGRGSTTYPALKLTPQYQEVPRVTQIHAKFEGNELFICDDNSGNSLTHTWSFGVEIGNKWYDPQIKNIGSAPPVTQQTRSR